MIFSAVEQARRHSVRHRFSFEGSPAQRALGQLQAGKSRAHGPLAQVQNCKRKKINCLYVQFLVLDNNY